LCNNRTPFSIAGYPLEVHEVLTPDGYLLVMERIPQHGATDVVFMMHGELGCVYWLCLLNNVTML
jgi:hypothetical protein